MSSGFSSAVHGSGFVGATASTRWCAIVFAALVKRALAGQLEAWADTPSGGLALVLLLDQFSRQIWRGEAKAFADDQHAQALIQKAFQQGWIQQEQELAKRHFWLMPLLHSEEREVLVRAIPMQEQFSDVAKPD